MALDLRRPAVRPAMCAECGWLGRRRWPSTVAPCPQCGSRDIRRRTGPRRVPRHEQTSPSHWTDWASDTDTQPATDEPEEG